MDEQRLALDIRVRADGTWLDFVDAKGNVASLRVETLADERRGLIGGVLRRWAKERQKGREVQE